MSINWIKSIKENENKGLSNLYRKYREEALHWIENQFGLSRDAACDIFQQSVIQIYKNIVSQKLTVLNSSMKTYLFGVIKIKSHEFIRENQRYIKGQEVNYYIDHMADMNDSIDREFHEENLDKMTKMLTVLGDPCKKLLELYYFKNMKMVDITEVMNYKNTNTTKNMKFKCLKRLLLILK